MAALAIITIMAATLFVGSTSAQAAQASLAWDASTGSTGYKVHIGSASRNYQQHIDVGSNTSYLTTQLPEGSTYYFAISAYNGSGMESGYSNEVSQYVAPVAATHTITATAGSGGKITALNNTKVSTATSGTTTLSSVTVSDGASQGFSIAATTGYRIADVKVDGVSVGAVASYTFTTVKAAHSIAATFTAATTSYTITASAGTGGTITPAGASSVTGGGSKSYSIAPAAGYRIAGVSVNGASVGAVASYTFTNVTANHTISASFAANTIASYTITASATTGGTISPAGSVAVSRGATQNFTIKPNTGYSIKSLQVDGKWIAAASSYTFSNVTASHTILAAFSATSTTSGTVASYTINASAGTGGTITPAGNVTVSHGASQSFTIKPNTGYAIKSLQVDGKWIAAAASYTFSNVTAGHSILAAFSTSSTTSTTSGTSGTSGTVVFATNSGGAYFKDSAGVTHSADSRYSGGSIKTVTSSFAGTVNDVLYQSYRYGNSFGYNIPLANGTYSMVLRFADNSGTGKRVFDVKAEGSTVLSNLDIYARAGNNTAYDVTIPVSVSDGTLNIGFVGKVGNAKINAIVIKTR